MEKLTRKDIFMLVLIVAATVLAGLGKIDAGDALERVESISKELGK